jgi:hypothetical protein
MSATVTDKKSDLERVLSRTVQRTCHDIPRTTKEKLGNYGAQGGPAVPSDETRYRGQPPPGKVR